MPTKKADAKATDNTNATTTETVAPSDTANETFVVKPKTKCSPKTEVAKESLPGPTEKTKQSIIPTVKVLEDVFAKMNNRFFESTLSTPVITVTPDFHRKGALGWCTSERVWVDGNNNSYFEINICADQLDRTAVEICETLLHEMCHLLNAMLGVQDTSRSGTYHNRKFKETAEAHGLETYVTADTKYGYNKTKLKPETEAFINSLDIEWGTLYREPDAVKPPAKSSTLKYQCPKCEDSFRATKELEVQCLKCNVKFEVQEQKASAT